MTDPARQTTATSPPQPTRRDEAAVWKSTPTWRGVDRRPDYVLAELANVEVEYRLAGQQEIDEGAAGWTACLRCAAPTPLQSEVCQHCGYHQRLAQQFRSLAPAAPAAPRGLFACCLAWMERCAQRLLPNRRALAVRDRAFNDQDLLRLVRLRRYRSLDFEGTQLSDESLDCLAQLTWLEFLVVRGTRISSEGVKYLRHKLPRCEVVD